MDPQGGLEQRLSPGNIDMQNLTVQVSSPPLEQHSEKGQAKNTNVPNHPDDHSSTPLSSDDIETELEPTFPEGGLNAWLVVFGSFCALIPVYGPSNSAAVFESYFSSNQLAGYDASAIGWIFSLYLFIVFFVGAQVGPIFDRNGPRVLVFFGSALCAASQLLLGLCSSKFHVDESFMTAMLSRIRN